jgi:hypothetical protein
LKYFPNENIYIDIIISDEKLDKFLKDNLKKDVKLLGESIPDPSLDFGKIKQIISKELYYSI